MPAILERAHGAVTRADEPERVSRIVEWSIDLDSPTPVEAALQAMVILRDPASIGTVFRVHTPEEKSVEVDLLKPENPKLSPDFDLTNVQLGRPYRLLRDVESKSGTGAGATAGEIVTPVRRVHPARITGPRWIGVVARGETVAREVVIPGREWLAAVTIY
jgi:hypothetical protein